MFPASPAPRALAFFLSVFVAVAAIADQHAQARVIDDFETAPFTLPYTWLGEIVQTGLDSNHVVGGRRRPVHEIVAQAGSLIALETTAGVDNGIVVSAPPNVVASGI